MHRTLGLSPGSIVFHRDMILDIPLIVDLERIREKRQAIIDEQIQKQNAKRVTKDYQPGEQVLKIVYRPDKLQPRNEGPYEILRTHVNGTVTIQLRQNLTERINIRRIRTFRT